MSENAPQPPLESTYRVKMYHPFEDGQSCINQGKSERLEVQAVSQPQLRVKIETTQHELFTGDKCKQCHALAKITWEIVPA